MEQFSILGHVGEGAHGIVFKAKHTEVGLLLVAWAGHAENGRGTNPQTRCFVSDRRDGGPEEGGPETAGGWHPQPGFEGDQSPAGDGGQ